jgi:hypothetical protein
MKLIIQTRAKQLQTQMGLIKMFTGKVRASVLKKKNSRNKELDYLTWIVFITDFLFFFSWILNEKTIRPILHLNLALYVLADFFIMNLITMAIVFGDNWLRVRRNRKNKKRSSVNTKYF